MGGGMYSAIANADTPSDDGDKPSSEGVKPATSSKSKSKTPVGSSAGINVPVYQPTYQSTNGDVENNVSKDPYILSIHKALRQTPIAAASYRLSDMEKKSLEVVLFEIRMKGIKSNENETMRIALNHLLNDYRAKGDESILMQVLVSTRA